jgi:P-type Ca2+ transporter type 2C
MELALQPLTSATPEGLTTGEARKLLAEVGPNTVGVDGQAAWWRTLLGVVREPMVLMLLICAGVYVVFGDLTEALILGASVVLVVVISLVQEGRTERALQALRVLSSPLASARDGRPVRVRASEVVPGDVLLLQEGDRVAADAVVVSASGLKVNGSLLTGESVAVRKRAVPAPVPLEPPGEGVTPFVYGSTLVVSGRAEAVVGATGARTEVGRIGRALETVSTAESPLNRQLAAKGAPEAVATLAGWDLAARRDLDAQVRGFAERGAPVAGGGPCRPQHRGRPGAARRRRPPAARPPRLCRSAPSGRPGSRGRVPPRGDPRHAHHR